ncbi:MAG: alpha/beta hydrolase [Clostridia bacterium]|nr:alpha/beta hydrolase [Clostridia bacterium]
MLEKWGIKVPRGGRKERTVYVWVPDSAEEDGDARYPVLYMFDGHNVFLDEDATYGKSWGLGDYLEESGTELIVVGIDCDHRANYARLKEYSPFDFSEEEFGEIKGRGRDFMRFMTRQLKPLIDERYPTIPDREATFIAGSSMGGLMSLYAVTAYNRYFSRAAALSPSVWVSLSGLEDVIRSSRLAPDTVVYMDYGERELANHPHMIEGFWQTATALCQRGVNLTARIVPGGDHSEASWERQLPIVMPTLLYEQPEPDGGD